MLILVSTGDYPQEFLDAVGWNQHRNPSAEGLPPNLSPGSDDELRSIEEAFEELSVNEDEDEDEEIRLPKKDPPVKQDPPNPQEYPDDDDDNMRIDVILQKNLPDPRGCHGVRHMLCCRAILPSGIKIDSIEVSIGRVKKQVVLTADLIEGLRFSDTSMCQITQYDRFNLNTTYQAYLNDNYVPKFRMTGDIPDSSEYENQFVHPGNNLAVTDPVLLGQCQPLPGIDINSRPADVAHFFVMSVAMNPNGSSNILRRNRTVYVSPQRQQPLYQAPPVQQPPVQQVPQPFEVPSGKNIAAAQAMATQQRARQRAAAQQATAAAQQAAQQAAAQQAAAQQAAQAAAQQAVLVGQTVPEARADLLNAFPVAQRVNDIQQNLFGQFHNQNAPQDLHQNQYPDFPQLHPVEMEDVSIDNTDGSDFL